MVVPLTEMSRNNLVFVQVIIIYYFGNYLVHKYYIRKILQFRLTKFRNVN